MLIIVGSANFRLYAEREAEPDTSPVSGFFMWMRAGEFA